MCHGVISDVNHGKRYYDNEENGRYTISEYILFSLHISRKDCKQIIASMFLSLPDMAWSPYRFNEYVQLIYLTALKSSLEHRRKHILRFLRLCGDKA